MRTTTVLLSLLLAFGAGLRAQEMTPEQFRTEFNKGLEYNDPKLMDKALKRSPLQALRYFEELQVVKLGGKTDGDAKIDALTGAWSRTFENTETLEKQQRWVESSGAEGFNTIEKSRGNVVKVWSSYTEQVAADKNKAEHKRVFEQLSSIAQNALSIGHNAEAAEVWLLASVVGSRMPDKDLDDRRSTLDALNSFLEARKGWNFIGDHSYLSNMEFVKAETGAIERAVADAEKRKKEGFAPDAKGVDALVLPAGKQESLVFKYEPLATWETDLDYGPKGGPAPPFWWQVSTEKDGSNRKMDWFRRVPLWAVRLGAAKFGVTLDPADPKKTVEIDAGNKGKPTTFWLDADKKVPYTMFFWVGSEKEHVGETDHNLAPSDNVGNIYYRSAASWKSTFLGEPIVLYDDNANGQPADSDPMADGYKTPTAGEHDTEGTPAPLLDSLRIAKGPRIPFSEFVQTPTGWFHLKRTGIEGLIARQLSPEYLKPGKVKFVWTGPKPAAPVQLVLQGTDVFKGAIFDVASGKEVEVPAGKYSVIFGRIVIGKGMRAQMATIYRGSSPEFEVEAGKVFELKMGAPFSMQFNRRGDQNTTIDALKIVLKEASGCILTDLQGMTLWPEVLAAKAEDGKGAKVVGKFVRFTDPELVNKAASKHNNVNLFVACFPMPEGYREGELVLSVKLPADGMKVGLQMKKHPVFGVVNSPFQ